MCLEREIMYESAYGLCDECKKITKDGGYRDSYCKNCREKYALVCYTISKLSDKIRDEIDTIGG